MHQNIKGTISVVSHGHGALVRGLLDDLRTQQGVADWRVVLTLNIPESGADRLDESDLADLNGTVIRNFEPKGFGTNHNACAAVAEGEVFLIVNPDIRLPDNSTLARLAQFPWHEPKPALRAPIVIAPDGAREDSVRRNLSLPNLLRRARVRESGWEADPSEPQFFWLAGMFLCVPLDFFRSIGGFDERFRLYCEDYDLSARWWLLGGEVSIIDDLYVVHDARRDSHRSWRHMRWHIGSLLRVWTSRAFWGVVASDHR
jgi:GT2 family glycosyltransferase